MARRKRLKSKPVGPNHEFNCKSQTESISAAAHKRNEASSQPKSERELESEFANHIYESYDELPSHKSFRRATMQPPEIKLSQKAVSGTPYDRVHTRQAATFLRSNSHQFENILEPSYLSSGSNAPRKSTSKINYFPEIALSSSKSALSTPSVTSQILRTQSSSRTLPLLSSSSAYPYSIRNKSVDTLLDKKRKFNAAPNMPSKMVRVEIRSHTNHEKTKNNNSDDDETWRERNRRLAAALLKDESPKPRTKPSVQVRKTPSEREATSTPCPAQRKVFLSGLDTSCFKNISTDSVSSKTSDPAKSIVLDDSSDDDCIIISESEALRSISMSQSKSRSPVNKSIAKKEEPKYDPYKLLDLHRIQYNGPIEMAGARRSTSIISGSANALDQPKSRKKAFCNTPSNLKVNEYVVDIASQVNVSSAGGSITSSNCDGFWDQDTDIDSLTKTKPYLDNAKESESDTDSSGSSGSSGSSDSSDSSDSSNMSESQCSESSESEYGGSDEYEQLDESNFGEDLARERRRSTRAQTLKESGDTFSVPQTRRMSERISKKPPIQYEVLPKEVRQTEPKKPKKPRKNSAKNPVKPSKRSKGTGSGRANENENAEEEEVLPEHLLSLLRPLVHPEPTGSIKCNFVVPTYFKTTNAFIPKYKSFRKYISEHPSVRSKEIDPWKMYRNGLKHFLECEEHRSQLPAIAFTAYVIDRNMGVNWGATTEKKWDNAAKKGETEKEGRKKRSKAEEKNMEMLHKNVKKINKGVKSLHRKVDSSSQTLSKVRSTLDEAAYAVSGQLV